MLIYLLACSMNPMSHDIYFVTLRGVRRESRSINGDVRGRLDDDNCFDWWWPGLHNRKHTHAKLGWMLTTGANNAPTKHRRYADSYILLLEWIMTYGHARP